MRVNTCTFWDCYYVVWRLSITRQRLRSSSTTSTNCPWWVFASVATRRRSSRRRTKRLKQQTRSYNGPRERNLYGRGNIAYRRFLIAFNILPRDIKLYPSSSTPLVKNHRARMETFAWLSSRSSGITLFQRTFVRSLKKASPKLTFEQRFFCVYSVRILNGKRENDSHDLTYVEMHFCLLCASKIFLSKSAKLKNRAIDKSHYSRMCVSRACNSRIISCAIKPSVICA